MLLRLIFIFHSKLMGFDFLQDNSTKTWWEKNKHHPKWQDKNNILE